MNFPRATVLVLACALPALSLAQWQWLDKDGHKVYSDQSPPAEVPAKNILHQPGPRGAPAQPAEQPALASEAKPAPSTPRISGKDKELQEKKRQAEAAEAESKRAGDEAVAKARAENCTRAKRAKVTLDSGIRISTTNAKGEREFMDDAARAAETRRIDGTIATDCKASGG
jgi:Domain of unknown function (DUF4124)